ncbi:unnamed protein product [Onchocerca flexuosa]|uniref:SCP domain-containing protein n=1 Tax=Onchocerca flexuosa TaxID=387005 RepID=A0A183H067_9BILA|nr:unnamed protein product [Onchocerca flexuosa]
MNIEKKADNRNFLVCDGCYMVSVLFSFENNAMLHFLFVFLLASLAPFGISNIIEKGSEIKRNQKTIEIIVQKYKALGSSEIDEIKNERYDFRLCACENKTGKSERSNSCNCSTVASGLTTYNSIPQTLYSSSCIRNPQYKKCLIAQVTVNTTQNLLYIKISVGSRHLTDPPYQSITNSKFKNTALLSCSKDTHYRNCIPCKSGFILLNYISLSSVTLVDSKQTYLSAAVQSGKMGLWSVKSLKKLSFTEIKDFNSIAKIEQCLLQNAKKYHLLPSQFSIATYKNAILTLHNVYRSKHGAGLLKVNIELERTAEIWAHRLASRADCLIHDPSKRFGENLFYYATNLLPDEETMALMTVQSFYLEAYGYNYKTSVTTKLYSEKKEAKHKPLQIKAPYSYISMNSSEINLIGLVCPAVLRCFSITTIFTSRQSVEHHYLDYNHTGHFTQLVWKSTTQMGVGIAMRRFSGHQANSCQPDFPSILFYVVIKYDPPGNILDMKNYDDNVLPPIR